MPNAYAGLYKYFNDLDEDCSGFLEKNEIHGMDFFRKSTQTPLTFYFKGLAKKFFGEEQQAKAEEYVDQVFDEFDVDRSGELSYEEARDFLKGIMAYLDKNGNLTDAARAMFMEMMQETDEVEVEEEESEEVVVVSEQPIEISASDISPEKDIVSNIDATKVRSKTISFTIGTECWIWYNCIISLKNRWTINDC